MLKKIHAVAASTVLMGCVVSASAFAARPPATPTLTLSGFACGASTVTTGQGGFVKCLGSYDGNIDNQLPATYSAMTAGMGFTTSTYFSSENFSSSGNPFAQNVGALDNGTIEFDQAQTGSFVIGLKQANYFALYQFNGALVNGGIRSIIYDAKGVNGVATKVLSHAGFLGTPTTGSPISPVPEADTYAMLLAGLGVIGFVARRRKAK